MVDVELGILTGRPVGGDSFFYHLLVELIDFFGDYGEDDLVGWGDRGEGFAEAEVSSGFGLVDVAGVLV